MNAVEMIKLTIVDPLRREFGEMLRAVGLAGKPGVSISIPDSLICAYVGELDNGNVQLIVGASSIDCQDTYYECGSFEDVVPLILEAVRFYKGYEQVGRTVTKEEWLERELGTLTGNKAAIDAVSQAEAPIEASELENAGLDKVRELKLS
jgi:hypothetical protein